MFNSSNVVGAELDLCALDSELSIEELSEGNALATLGTASCIGCLTCPISSGGTASTIGTAV